MVSPASLATSDTSTNLYLGVTTGVGATHRGPHKTETANVLDPNVSSGSTGIGRGPTMTSTTAGPHKSDMMNKLDPR